MTYDPRVEVLKLMSQVEGDLATVRGLLSQPIDSATTLRCVELITALRDTMKILEIELHKLEQ